MSDDYLWDGSGPSDPEVLRLERELREFRFSSGEPPAFRNFPGARRRQWPAALAASALFSLAGLQLWLAQSGNITEWRASVADASGEGSRQAVSWAPVRAGQSLRTGDDSRIILRADGVGQIEVEPNSELRVLASSSSQDWRQMALRRGKIHALIWAPPRQFVVDTPSARAVDLGCEYTLDVDANGNGLLRVETGWVAFQQENRESFIPAGASCRTLQQTGPGIPVFDDAAAPFRRALTRFEDGDAGALDEVLANARPRDGLSLWHILARAGPADRRRVFDRFAALVALPAGVAREEIEAGDPKSLDLCWDALGLQGTEWWRTWERPWHPRAR